MNFEDVQFWVVLFLFGTAAIVLRLAVARMAPAKVAPYDVTALAATSLGLFYFAAGTSFWIFLGELAFTYAMLWVIAHKTGVIRWVAVIAGVAVPLGVLMFYKYWDFLLGGLTGVEFNHAVSSIPPGVSFYTFEMIATVVDSFRGRYDQPRLIDYLNYGSFFPQVVAGPIERRHDLLPQVRTFTYRLSWDKVAAGLPLIVLGLFYKLVLADNLAPLIHRGPVDNAYVIWGATFLFGLRIYFDFAGYSLIAVGLGKAVGVTLHYNFLAPYTARNVRDFWRRWHVTLSQWFRDFVYLPLGGSRSGLLVFNIIVTFVLSGLWHGAGINFALWGLVHGCLLTLHVAWERLSRRSRPRLSRLSDLSAWALTCVVVTASWLFFYETDSGALFDKLRTLGSVAGYAPAKLTEAFYDFSLGDRIVLGVLVAMSLTMLVTEQLGRGRQNPYAALLSPRVSCALMVLVVLFSAGQTSQFIYFRF